MDRDGKPKYALHAFRHFFASWCINLKERGGWELPPKMVQADPKCLWLRCLRATLPPLTRMQQSTPRIMRGTMALRKPRAAPGAGR